MMSLILLPSVPSESQPASIPISFFFRFPEALGIPRVNDSTGLADFAGDL